MILLTDVGSTTTKAVLLRPEGPDGSYRLAARADAATTVEAPDENVVVGVRRAVSELGRRTGAELLTLRGQATRLAGDKIKRYLSTSSAGGGLQVMVCGVMRGLTARSAEQAALGAGAIVLDVLAVDDNRTPLQRYRAISAARPDMVLVAGGMDGGTPRFILETCDFLNLSDMRPRFGHGYRLPIVFAGAETVRSLVAEMLSRHYDVLLAPNLRPDISRENLEPVRRAIVEIFETHVMKQAPGYEELLEWVDGAVLPTPVAAGLILGLLSKEEDANVICMDLGGATTDVFSFVDGRFTRSVSANLGVSYSATNVMANAGAHRIASWLPFTITEDELRDQIGSKTLHPTTIPETVEELLIEQALATEALRLATEQHLAVFQPESGPRDVSFGRDQARMYRRREVKAATTQDLAPGIIIGSGGLLASAPLRTQAAMALLNGAPVPGAVRLYVDSVFMLPHLGILSQDEPQIALDVLYADCLVPLGTAVRPRQAASRRRSRDDDASIPSGPAAVALVAADGRTTEAVVPANSIVAMALPEGDSAELSIVPHRDIDYGAGPGQMMSYQVTGGLIGVIVDNRVDPTWRIGWPTPERVEQVHGWLRSLAALPEAWTPPQTSHQPEAGQTGVTSS